MGTKRSGSGVTFWGMLLRPSATFQALVVQGNDDVSILPMILAGSMGLLFWADAFDLGSRYETGGILSGGLILGPLIGVFWLILMGLFGLWFGNLLDRRHTARFQFHVLIPPFPLKNLVWIKVLGPEKIRRMFSRPFFRHGLQLWSWLNSAGAFLKDSVSNGRMRFTQVLGGLAKLAMVFFPMAVIVWMAANFLDQTGFGRAGETTEWDGLFLILKCIFFLVFGYFWLRLLRAGFELDWARTLLAGLASLMLSLATVICLVAFFTGIQLM